MQHIQHPRQSRSARTRPPERRITAACAQPRYARLHTVANEETSNPESMAGESADVEHINSPTAGVPIHGLENQQIGKQRCASGGTDRGGENKAARPCVKNGRFWPHARGILRIPR